MKDPAQAALLDQSFGQGHSRNPAVVEPDEGRDSAELFGHGLCLGQGRGQGFFAQYNLPRLGSGHGNRGVQGVRNRNINHIDIRPGHDGLPIGCGFTPSPLRRSSFQLGRIASADHLQVELMGSVEKVPHLAKSIGMGLGDKASANHGQVESGLRHLLEPACDKVRGPAKCNTAKIHPSGTRGHPTSHGRIPPRASEPTSTKGNSAHVRKRTATS